MKKIRSLIGVLLVLIMLGSVVSPVLAVNTAKMKSIPKIELHKNVNVIKMAPLNMPLDLTSM
jgi:uncharacterized surface anchored protein